VREFARSIPAGFPAESIIATGHGFRIDFWRFPRDGLPPFPAELQELDTMNKSTLRLGLVLLPLMAMTLTNISFGQC
jgi:hypothetical protein